MSAWFAQRVDGGAQATKHRISKNSRAFLRYAAARGYTTHDLASAIDPFRAGSSRVDWLEWEEIHRLIAALPEQRLKFAVAWLFWTGCRGGEACAAVQADVQWRNEPGSYQWTIPDSKTHSARVVWLPEHVTSYIESSRQANKSRPHWPLLWDCEGRGYARVENPVNAISPRTINAALERAAEAINLQVHVTAHVAKHSYCTNWINEYGSGELAMEKLSRQVGTSVTNLRKHYVHLQVNDVDWAQIKSFGKAS